MKPVLTTDVDVCTECTPGTISDRLDAKSEWSKVHLRREDPPVRCLTFVVPYLLSVAVDFSQKRVGKVRVMLVSPVVTCILTMKARYLQEHLDHRGPYLAGWSPYILFI